jgi:hypothetical protein
MAIAVTAAALAVMVTIQSVAADPNDFLRCEPIALQNMFYFHPGETHTLKAWVVNTGTYMDSYELTVDVDGPPRWVVALDLDRADDVQPGEKVAFNLSITAALDAQEGDHIFVNVTARSLMSNKTDSLNFISFVIVSRDVRISCDNLTREMDSGETISFLLDVTNTGDVNDSYKIEWITYPGDAPWSAEVSASTFDLERGKSMSILFNVTSPDDRAEDGSVWVSATSTADKRATDSLVLHCHVKVRWSASVQPANGTILVRPGVAERFELNLTQLTNDRRDRNWSLDLSVTDPTWSVEATPRDFVMAGTCIETINLTVTAPARSSPWESAALIVVLRCEQNHTEEQEALFSLQVAEVHKLVLLRYPDQTLSHYSGQTVSTDFDVQNVGNVPEIFEVKITPLYGCTLRSSIGTIEGPWFQLLPLEKATIRIQLTLPVHPSRYSFDQNLTMISASMDLLTIEFQNHIMTSDGPPRLTFRLSGDTENVILVEAGGQSIKVNFTIENLNPERLDVAFCSTVDNPRCSAWVQATVLHLLPFGTRDNWVNLHAEKDAPFGNYVLKINPSFGAFGLEFNITVVGPDLQLGGLQLNNDAVEGEVVSYSLTISNVGRGRSDPTTLIVKGTGDFQLVTPVYVPSIAPGTWFNVTVGFIPYSGNNKYTFIVDPNVTMREDGNATDRLSIWLEPSPQADAPPSLPMSLIIPLVILVVLILSIVVLRKMRGEPGDGQGHERRAATKRTGKVSGRENAMTVRKADR